MKALEKTDRNTAGTGTGRWDALKRVAIQVNSVANLTDIGGSLASAMGSQGIVTVKINFGSNTDVGALFSTFGSISGTMNDGSITPTPEPSSMLLMGSGLIVVGRMLRRRSQAKANLL